MQLLISVSSVDEARDALVGGADIVDAKDPQAGALGAVAIETLRSLYEAAASACPVSAALGDASDERATETLARTFAATGIAFLKLGFGAIADPVRVGSLIDAAVRGAEAGSHGVCRVVAVCYADASGGTDLPAARLVEVAAGAGASGILVDTADKHAPGLTALVGPEALRTIATRAHDAGLFAAFAGRLDADDLVVLDEAGADIAGVRGAACVGGRTGRVSPDLVRLLGARCRQGADAGIGHRATRSRRR